MSRKGFHVGHVTKDGILDMQRSRVAYFNPQDTGGMLIELVTEGTIVKRGIRYGVRVIAWFKK